VYAWLKCLIYKGPDGKRVALSCFQPRRVPIGFGVAPWGKALSIVPPAAFSKYKDLHRSLFSQCLLHLSSHISLLSPRSFSYRKGLRPPSCCLAGFYRPSPIALLGPWHKAFLLMAFPFEITLLHLSPYALTLSWPAHFRLRLKPAMQVNPLIRHLVPCRLRCSSAPTEMIPVSTLLERPELCRSGPSCPRPSFASHCFTTAQLICDSATALVGNFSLWRAFQGEATVWL